MELPTIEVRYESLKVEAECEIVEGKALPTLWNTAKRVVSVSIYTQQFLQNHKVVIALILCLL